MESDFFFVTKAKGFDIDAIELPPRVKTRWKEKCAWASQPDAYERYIQMPLDLIGFKKKCDRASQPDAYERWIQVLLDLTGFREGIKVLDVGCGVGAEIIELSHLGANCFGLDADTDLIRLINHIRDEFGLNVTGLHGDACLLPFDDEAFDVVMSFEFFEHVRDLDAAMKEQIRVLKRGGRLVIEQGHLFNPFTVFDLVVKYPRRTCGRHGGIKWLLSKGKVVENLYGTGCAQKDEDVHTRLWWNRKMKQYSSVLEVREVTSSLVKMRGKLFRLLEPLSNILIVATKR